jgi:hypothetical protein
MLWMNRFDKHADLVNRMAETLGVDLTEEMLRGHLPPQDLRTTVLNCISCSEDGACSGWLEEHAGGSDVTPPYCRNKARLEGLAQG